MVYCYTKLIKYCFTDSELKTLIIATHQFLTSVRPSARCAETMDGVTGTKRGMLSTLVVKFRYTIVNVHLLLLVCKIDV